MSTNKMIANCHLGFNCENVEESIKFYEKYLGMKVKFVLGKISGLTEIVQYGAVSR